MGHISKIAKYWDDVQSTIWDYEADTQFFHEIFNRKQVKSVLDLGCGTGTHLINLAKLGYECTGIDNSPDMLEVARKKAEKMGLKIVFIESDMRDIGIEKKYDASICMYTITFPDIEDVKKIFCCVYNILDDKGLFIFDVITPMGPPPQEMGPKQTPPIPPMLPEFFNIEVFTPRREDVKIVRFNTFSPKGTIQNWDAVYLFDEKGKVTMEIHQAQLRMFAPEEIEGILHECGFKIEKTHTRQIRMMKNELICAYK